MPWLPALSPLLAALGQRLLGLKAFTIRAMGRFPQFHDVENTVPKPYTQGQPDGCRIRFSGKFLGGRLTTPETATKLNVVAPPLWGPGGYDKGKDPVNRNDSRLYGNFC